MKNLLIPVLFLFSGACTHQTPTSGERSAFFVAAPDLLYFRNLRQTAYRQLPARQEGIDVFVPRTWPEVKEGPALIPKLVINWLKDEAYLMLELQPFKGTYAEPLVLYRTSQGKTDSILVESLSMELQLELAYGMLEKLQDGYHLGIRSGSGQSLPIFEAEEEQKALATAVRDFQRLTGK